MSFLRHGKIYQSDEPEGGEARGSAATATIVPMSLQPAIPSRVALQQSPCPLRRSSTASLSILLYSPRQRNVNCPYFPCLNTGVHSTASPSFPTSQAREESHKEVTKLYQSLQAAAIKLNTNYSEQELRLIFGYLQKASNV